MEESIEAVASNVLFQERNPSVYDGVSTLVP